MKYRDLREFIDKLKQENELVEISAEVDPVLEVTEICDRVLRAGGPAILFTNPKGSEFPLLANLFGTPRRVAMGMGEQSVDALREVGKLLAFLKEPDPPKGVKQAWQTLPIYKKVLDMAPKTVSSPECQEVVIEADRPVRPPARVLHQDRRGRVAPRLRRTSSPARCAPASSDRRLSPGDRSRARPHRAPSGVSRCKWRAIAQQLNPIGVRECRGVDKDSVRAEVAPLAGPIVVPIADDLGLWPPEQHGLGVPCVKLKATARVHVREVRGRSSVSGRHPVVVRPVPVSAVPVSRASSPRSSRGRRAPSVRRRQIRHSRPYPALDRPETMSTTSGHLPGVADPTAPIVALAYDADLDPIVLRIVAALVFGGEAFVGTFVNPIDAPVTRRSGARGRDGRKGSSDPFVRASRP